MKELQSRWVRVETSRDVMAYVPARHFLIGHNYLEIRDWCEENLTPKKWRVDFKELPAFMDNVGYGAEQYAMIEIDADVDLIYFILRWV
jgi:hypothetical protein